MTQPRISDSRYRLIPSRGPDRSWHVDGCEAALAHAREYFKTSRIPVLVCEAPEGGVVRPVEMVGGPNRRRRGRA